MTPQKKALYSGVLPMLIMTAIAVMLHFQHKPADARSTFCVGLIILAIGLANMVYDIDNWSVAKKIGIHYVLMLATVFPILLFSGWFPVNGPVDVAKVFGIFSATGVGILAVIGAGYWVFARRTSASR